MEALLLIVDFAVGCHSSLTFNVTFALQVGSTIGNVICIIFPAVIFVKLTSRNTTERLAAQVMS